MALDLPAASRESLADLASRLEVLVDQVGPAELDAFGDELFAVARLLAAQIGLRRHLADPSVPESARTDVVERLLAGKVQRPALEAVQAAAAARWSRSADLIDALQTLARTAVLASAEKTGRLDEAEDELFRFGRILDREPELARLLADPVTPIEGRIRLLDQLLSGKVTQTTATLLRQAVELPRGQHLDVLAEELAEMAAARRHRSIARVTTAVRLTPDQEQRLVDTLSRLYGRPMSLQVELDESLLGGLVVRVGNEVIDGSVAGRLETARRLLPH
ncbi:MAG: synthase subunit delta [Pseudonocardia sp.]|jgi:F-type H+-transporting ATPase subunit delta|nr:synthase subunit delta [Pseudonocardia sp.]